MEVNKQLFEDVLAGKLKGTFVLRNGFKCSSKQLDRNYNWHAERCPYRIQCRIYRTNGIFGFTNRDSLDIIDFIPDTVMKENELTIEIPDGKIVDWEESKKQNRIVLKDKQLTYEDICKKLFNKEYYLIGGDGGIRVASYLHNIQDINNAPTVHQLECILAKNKLANVAKYLNDGWKPIKDDRVFIIMYRGDFNSKPFISEHYFWTGENLVLFKTQELAQQAIEILGEETVKLALEPLGI